MMKHIKMITFDLDDTLWDNRPTIMKAEIDTRKWIEDKVGEIEWGDFNDFLNLREDLIKEDKTIEWDISKLRKEIFRKKLWHVTPEHFRDEIVDKAFEIFIAKRHEIKLFNGVKESLKNLSKKFQYLSLKNQMMYPIIIEIGEKYLTSWKDLMITAQENPICMIGMIEVIMIM